MNQYLRLNARDAIIFQRLLAAEIAEMKAADLSASTFFEPGEWEEIIAEREATLKRLSTFTLCEIA